MLFNLWWGWRYSSLMLVLPHCDPFPVTSMGCCWVPVNFPCWVPVPHRPSTGGPASSSGSLTSSGGSCSGFQVRCMPSTDVQRSSREGFCPGPQHRVASLLLTQSRQLSSRDRSLGTFVSQAQTFPRFSC
jgi:hypothetical protein